MIEIKMLSIKELHDFCVKHYKRVVVDYKTGNYKGFVGWSNEVIL